VTKKILYDGTSLPPKEVAAPTGTPMQEWSPDDYTVAEVQEYLETADEAERSRVLSLEAQGKARKTILGEADATTEGVDVEYVQEENDNAAGTDGPGEDQENA
jgi:hypothetical protein